MKLFRRPDASPSLEEMAENLLRRADAIGKLPTPIDDLIATAQLEEPRDAEAFVQSFVKRLATGAGETFLAAIQKVRGIADLRQRAIYVQSDTTSPRRLFVKCHELAHQVIPWHSVNPGYRDDDLSLSANAQDMFDHEANFYSAELIFQGRHFRTRARDFAVSFDAVFQLADQHGASRFATLWKFVEEQDETIAAIPYWPGYAVDQSGNPILRQGKAVASPRFMARYADVELPAILEARHPWSEARTASNPVAGRLNLRAGQESVLFDWESWWNGYSLLVLLRRRPSLSVVGRIVRTRV